VTYMLKKIKDADDKLIEGIAKLHNPVLNKIMLFMTFLGDQGKIWFLVLAIIVFFRRSLYIGVTFFSALFVSWLFAEIIIKRIVCRVRPCHKIEQETLILKKIPKFYSFPSSHSATSFAMFTVSIFFCPLWATMVMLVIAVGISFSRFYLQAHYLTDVICGIFLGVLIAVISVAVNYHIMHSVNPLLTVI